MGVGCVPYCCQLDCESKDSALHQDLNVNKCPWSSFITPNWLRWTFVFVCLCLDFLNKFVWVCVLVLLHQLGWVCVFLFKLVCVSVYVNSAVALGLKACLPHYRCLLVIPHCAESDDRCFVIPKRDNDNTNKVWEKSVWNGFSLQIGRASCRERV